MSLPKRQATEELLPTRASKIPRVTASQHSNLSRTWSALRGYFTNVAVSVGHNVSAFIEASTQDVGQPPPPLTLTPRRRQVMPSRLNQQQPNQSNPPPLPPPPRTRQSYPTSPPVALDASHIPPSQLSAQLSQAHIPSLVSARFGISHPALDAELQASAQRRRKDSHRQKNASLAKFYESRDHIHAKSHKAWVQEERKKDKQDMIKEIWETRRRHGYKSDLKTFESLLRFQQHLEGQQHGRDAFSPSSSMTDLRSAAVTSKQQRRHSSSEFHLELSTDFLERAFRNAKQSLNGPKPMRPFSPSLDQLRLSTKAKDEEIERRLHGPKRIPLPPSLPPDDEVAVDAILKRRGVISKFVREQVTDKDISRLKPCQWLNDEIINFYGQMLLSRSEDNKENPGVVAGVNGHMNGKVPAKKYLSVHYFSTFFWSKLNGDGYEKGRLAKWTKTFDIFQKDVILIPINHNNSHWTAAAINFKRKRIESYDSMGMDRLNVYKRLREYVDAEHRNKKKKPFDFSGWEDWLYEDTPQQENGYDCGVFTCQFLATLSRGEETFNFTQGDMPYLRRRMIWEIGNSRLRDDP